MNELTDEQAQVFAHAIYNASQGDFEASADEAKAIYRAALAARADSADILKLVEKYGEECARVEYLTQCDQCQPKHEEAKQDAMDAVAAALAAAPAPASAAKGVSTAERDAFEAWIVSHWRGRGFATALSDAEMLQRDLGGRYHSSLYEAAWEGYQFGRTLAAPSHPPATPAVRCNLCHYQHGHCIGCPNNPVDKALAEKTNAAIEAHRAAHPKPAAPAEAVSDEAIAAVWRRKYRPRTIRETDEAISFARDILALRPEIEAYKRALIYVAYGLHGTRQHMLCKGITLHDANRVTVKIGDIDVDTGRVKMEWPDKGASDLGRTAPVAKAEPTLPYDITVGGGTFRKGVKLSTFVMAAQAWHRQADPKFYTLTDEDKAKNLRRLQGAAGGDAS